MYYDVRSLTLSSLQAVPCRHVTGVVVAASGDDDDV